MSRQIGEQKDSLQRRSITAHVAGDADAREGLHRQNAFAPLGQDQVAEPLLPSAATDVKRPVADATAASQTNSNGWRGTLVIGEKYNSKTPLPGLAAVNLNLRVVDDLSSSSTVAQV